MSKMTLEQASAVLDQVWLDTFLSKAAELGYSPDTQAGQQRLVDIALRLQAIEAHSQKQAAAANGSLFDRAYARLVAHDQSPQQLDPQVTKTAQWLGQMPVVRQAVETLLSSA